MKQFSIRDLLLICVILALILGWWLDRRPRPTHYEVQATTKNAFVLDTTTGELRVWKIDERGFENFQRSYKVTE